jgi:hypothetical protein
VLTDLIAGVDAESSAAALDELAQAGATVVDSDAGVSKYENGDTDV